MSGLSVYRKIWTNANGPIPVDSDGRTFHIHHVDGNRDNNELSNLQCLSIMDHYRLHERQCDWGACAALIMHMPEKFTPEQVSEIHRKAANALPIEKVGVLMPHVREANRIAQQKLIDAGKHHLQSGDIQRRSNRERVVAGTHNFQQQVSVDAVRKRNSVAIEAGTHPFQDSDAKRRWQNEKVRAGIHHLQSPEHSARMTALHHERVKKGEHPFQKDKYCEWCGNSGKGGFWYNHGDYCQQNPNNNRVTCEYCNANSHPRIHMRYHGDNCKKNKS